MIKLTMLSSAEKVKGQGVASAYRELVSLLERQQNQPYDLAINQYHKSDITHYHTVDVPFYLSTFSKKRGVKVGYVHFLPETMDESLQLPKAFRLLFDRYLLSFYKRMDQLVVVNPSFISKLEALGVKRDRIHFIPNFVSKSLFSKHEQSERSTLRHSLGIPEDAFVVLGAGQVQHRKGVLDFIEVAKQMPDVHFIWAGGFSFGRLTAGYQQLKQIVDAPPANVSFPGIVDRSEMPAYYQAADVFFSPSYNELFPMTILEAMSCGKPLVLRNLSLYEDILFDYYHQASDNNGFARLIERLRADDSFYKTAAKQADQGAFYYSEERLTDVWNDFYQQLATDKTAPSYG
ncbi:glycosyltransferase family 4 protein [Shouchella patagoniensis]|uniref:glycosyltransferase family 4 protein n=1 Tax=Shouchella patagoniensis TaxID=228576 RepID=UPI000995C68C|nr:glycosyltransferase family 4 protein [Shouchella patagoniensis]